MLAWYTHCVERSVVPAEASTVMTSAADHVHRGKDRIAVLMVDDDRQVRLHLRWALQCAGWTVHVAEDAAHALVLVLALQPQCTVVSARSCGGRGRDVVAVLQAIAGRGSGLTVLLGGSRDRRRFRASQHLAVLEPAASPDELAAQLSRLVRARGHAAGG